MKKHATSSENEMTQLCPEYIWIVNPMLLSTLSDSLSWCSCYSTGTHLGKKEINVYHYPDILNTLISSTIQIS